MAFKIINKETGFEVNDDNLCLKPDGNIYEATINGGCSCCGTWLEFEIRDKLMAKYDS